MTPTPEYNLLFPPTESTKTELSGDTSHIPGQPSCFLENLSLPVSPHVLRLDTPAPLAVSSRHSHSLHLSRVALSPPALPESYPIPLTLPDGPCHALNLHQWDTLYPLGTETRSHSTSTDPRKLPDTPRDLTPPLLTQGNYLTPLRAHLGCRMLDCLHGIASPPLSSPKDVLSSRVCVPLLQLCSTLCNPMDSSLPDPSVHGILQARILEWVAIPFSRGYS